MKLLRETAIIVGICFLGETISKLAKLPIPGNVMGMIILLSLLLSGIIKMNMIENISEFLLKHLAFFFIPAGVGLIAVMDILGDNLGSIITIAFITTIIVMATTGLTVQFLIKKNKS